MAKKTKKAKKSKMTMILIPGRSSKQGVGLNIGKLKSEYREVTSTVEMNEHDMATLGLAEGDKVRLSNRIGKTVVTCASKTDEDLPRGLLFIAYGPPSSALMDGETFGTGMPGSKNFEVEVESA